MYFIRGCLIGVIVFLLFMFLSETVFAQEVPEYLKGGTIEVTLKTGEKYQFSADEYAVVKRQAQMEPEARVALERLQSHIENEMAVASRKNTIKLYGGYGPDGYSVSHITTGAKVKQSYGLMNGLGFDHRFTDRLVGDGIVLFNQGGVQGGLLGLGYRF